MRNKSLVGAVVVFTVATVLANNDPIPAPDFDQLEIQRLQDNIQQLVERQTWLIILTARRLELAYDPARNIFVKDGIDYQYNIGQGAFVPVPLPSDGEEEPEE